jgi:alpha-tubulin suppressor-like RCC1 family protein
MLSETQMQSNIDGYFALISDNINTKVLSFDSNSINFGNDTLLRGNLVVLGTVYTIASDVVTEDNTFILNNYGASAQEGLDSVSKRSLVYLDTVVLSTSNVLSERTIRDFENLKLVLNIDGINSLLTNNFTLADFNQMFSSKTLDDIGQGTSNRYITNNEYTPRTPASPFIVAGNLTNSNIIANNIYANNNIYAKVFYGDGSGITNINSTFFNTNTLVETSEASNLYFTPKRAGIIADSSNVDTSNYVSDINSYFMQLLTTENTNLSNFVSHSSNNVIEDQRQQTADFDSFINRYANSVVLQIDGSALDQFLYFEESSNHVSIYYETSVAHASNYIDSTSNDVSQYRDTLAMSANEYMQHTSNSLYIDLDAVYIKHYDLTSNTSNYSETVLYSSNIDVSNLIADVENILTSYLQQSNLHTSQHIHTTHTTNYAYIGDARLYTSGYLEAQSNYVIDTAMQSFTQVYDTLRSTSNTTTIYLNENIQNLSNYIHYNSNDLAFKIATELPMNIITYAHLMHYKFQESSLLDDETNVYDLTNYGGSYALSENRNSIFFDAGEYAGIPNVDWSQYDDLTISGWFKTANLTHGDRLFEFSYLDIVSDQLKAWYNFESNLNDSTANNSTLISGVGSDAPTFSSILKMLGQSSVEYTSLTQYLQSSDINLSNKSFSISFWLHLKNTTDTSDWWIMSQGLPGLRQLFHIAFVNQTFKFGFWNDDLFTSTLNLNDINDTWNHMVFVYDKEDNRTMKVYINNVLVASKNAGGDTQFDANTFRIGKGIATGNGFVGNMDDLKVYYKALSANEIQRLYDINTQRKNIKVLHEADGSDESTAKLSFVIDEVPVYSVAYTPAVWNHIIWNVLSQGYIKINNGEKQYFGEVQITSGSYTNVLGSGAASGSGGSGSGGSGSGGNVYVSDFRVLTIPMTTAIETEIYSPASTEDIINNYEDINIAVADTTRHIASTWDYLNDFSNYSFVDASNTIRDSSNAINTTINVFITTQASDKETLIASLSSTLNNSVTTLTTDDIPETADHIYYTDARLFASLNTRTLDQIPRNVGGSNSVIVDNIYDSNLYVQGNLTAYNVELFGAGGKAVFNTAIYNDERIEVFNYSNVDAIKLDHYVSTLANSLELANNTGGVFTLRNDGRVGVKTPVSDTETLDVAGIVRADYFSASGEGLVNINLSMKTTADLAETIGGSNLYFTNTRVSSILTGSNILTSNYVANESNVVLTKMRAVDTNISNLVVNVSNILIFSTESIGSNFVSTTSNSVFGYIIAEGTNQSNNVWNMSNYVFGNFSNLYIYSNQSNFMFDASNLIHQTINYSNYIMSNFVVLSSNANDVNRQNSLTNQSNYMSIVSNLITDSTNTIVRDHSNLIMGFSNLFASSLAYTGINNISNYIEITSNNVMTTLSNIYMMSSNYMSQENTKIIDYASATISDLASTYKAGDVVQYSHTFDSNIVFMNFRDTKILNGVNSDFWRITSNTCNYLSVYPVINNFTRFNDRPNYLATNEWAFRSTSNVYMYVSNQYDILKLMNALDDKAFGIHFVFNTAFTQNTPIYFLGTNNKLYLSLKISNGYLYFIIGNGSGNSSLSFYASTTLILPNTWYTIDFAFETRRASGGDNGNVGVRVFINLIPQMINFTSLNKAYDTRYYSQGAVYTNTYYSSNSWVSGGLCPIMQSCAHDYASYSNLIFSSYFASNYDYQYSSNVSAAGVLNAGFYDFADTNRLVIGDRSVANLNFVFTEVETNIKLQAGYYYFMLDLQNEITADLLIGNYTHNSIDEYLNVANYYESNFLLGGIPSVDLNATSNQVMTYPMYIAMDGYYRFYLRMFRHINDRHKKYFMPKYYYTPVWSGSSYTFDTVKSGMTYISYNTLDSSIANNKADFNQLYHVNSTATGATSNLYVYDYTSYGTFSRGTNNNGALGINNTTYTFSTNIFQTVKGVAGIGNILGITKVAAYENSSLFLKESDGTVYACGYNGFGQLGLASYSDNNAALQQVKGENGVGVISNVSNIYIGYQTSFFVMKSGGVYACGANSRGQQGRGSSETGGNVLKPVLGVNGTGVLQSIKQVACTNGANPHTLFVSTNGILYSCGYNRWGQLGIGSTSQTTGNSEYNIKQVSVSAVNQAGVGDDVSFILFDNGGVSSCGYDEYVGQNLANGNAITTFQNVPGLTGGPTQEISVSNGHTLFRQNDGFVFGTGTNTSGQLGRGTVSTIIKTVNNVRINASTNLSGIQQIYAMQGRSYFVKSDGSIFVAGDNSTGVFGNIASPVTYATNIPTLNGSISLASGQSHIVTAVMSRLSANVSNYNYNISHTSISDSFFVTNQTSNSMTDTTDVVQNQTYTSNLAYEYSSNTTMYLGAYSNFDSSFYDNRTYTQGAVYTNTYYSTNPWTVPTAAPITRTAAKSYAGFSNLIFSSYYASNFDYQYSLGISSANVVNNAYFDNADTRIAIGDRGISALNFVLTEVEANVKLNTGYYYFMLDLQNEITADLLLGKNTDKSLDEYANVANYYGDLLNNPSSTISHPTNMTTMYPIYIPEGYYRFYLRMFRTIANRNNKYFIPKYYYTSTWTSPSYTLNSGNEIAYMPYSLLPAAYKTASVNFNNLYFVNNSVTGATSNLYVYRYFNQGTFACGWNGFGELGVHALDTADRFIPTQVLNYSGGTGTYISGITQIACGTSYSFFRRSDGAVFACGWNYYGQLGVHASDTTNRFIPTQVLNYSGGTGTYISGITQIAAAGTYSVFRRSDGVVFACGINNFGQLGVHVSDTASRFIPTQVLNYSGGSGTYISGITQIAAGNGHSLFLKSDSAVFACGWNGLGQLGVHASDTTNRFIPTQVLNYSGGTGAYISGITQIAAGGSHSLFRRSDGAVFACGGNGNGSLGVHATDTANRFIPTQVLNISGITQIAAGQNHSLFLSSDGTVFACGNNTNGRLGVTSVTTDTANRFIPTQVLNYSGGTGTYISGITQIAAGNGHSLFLSSDGAVFACGDNTNGRLGVTSVTTDTANRFIPTQVLNYSGGTGTYISGITQIAARGSHSLFIQSLPILTNVSNYTYNIPHSNIPNTFFAGITSNNIQMQDFRIYPANSTNDIIHNISNNLWFGFNPPSEYTITSNIIVKQHRWLESANYSSRLYDPFGRYITYNDTGDMGVSIGKSSTPEATLDIYTADPTLYSIKTNNPIWVQSGVVASSDKRIKANIRDFNADDALNQILSIQPKTYNYVDRHRAADTVIGFSAQQIKEVIPNAVSLHTEPIPNIQSAAYLQGNTIYLTEDIDITNKISKDTTIILEYNNTKYYERATEILNTSTFKIENKSGLPNTSLFVYGTIIDDFHSLDKNYVYTLSVCATQDIHKKQEALYNSINAFVDTLDVQSLEIVASNIQQIKHMTSMTSLTSTSNIIGINNILYENLMEIREKLNTIDIQGSSAYNIAVDSILQNNSNILSKNQEIIANNNLYITTTNNLDVNINKINDILQRNNLA